MYRTSSSPWHAYDDTVAQDRGPAATEPEAAGLVSWLLGLSCLGVGAVFSILLLRHRSPGAEAAIHSGQARGGILLWALVEHGC